MFNSAGTRGKSWGRIIKINRFELLTNRKRAVTFLHVQNALIYCIPSEHVFLIYTVPDGTCHNGFKAPSVDGTQTGFV